MQSVLLKAVKKSGDNFMTIKLKAEPCNCGSIPEIRDAWTYVDFPAKTAPGFQVVCPVCKTQSIIRGTKNAAIKDWNHGKTNPVFLFIFSISDSFYVALFFVYNGS